MLLQNHEQQIRLPVLEADLLLRLGDELGLATFACLTRAKWRSLARRLEKYIHL